MKYLSKTKHVQGTPTILDRGLDNRKNRLGACRRILMNFLPQEVYLKMNKFHGIHNLKFCLKKSCPGDNGTILERMPPYTEIKILISFGGLESKLTRNEFS